MRLCVLGWYGNLVCCAPKRKVPPVLGRYLHLVTTTFSSHYLRGEMAIGKNIDMRASDGARRFLSFRALKHDTGASLVEYALLAAFLVVVLIGTTGVLGGKVEKKISSSGEQLFAGCGQGEGGLDAACVEHAD